MQSVNGLGSFYWGRLREILGAGRLFFLLFIILAKRAHNCFFGLGGNRVALGMAAQPTSSLGWVEHGYTHQTSSRDRGG